MPVVLALGFRLFFLLAGLFAILLIAPWIAGFSGGLFPGTYYGEILWHSHEMIFGYTTAVIAGFLLTAVRNWTQQSTPTGAGLAALAALWVLARILPFFPGSVTPWLIAAVDLAFLPMLVVALAFPLMRAGERRNLVFLPLLLAFWTGNAMIHAELLGSSWTLARTGIFLAVHLVVLLIVILGGRVIPFFTERALPGVVVRRWRVIEWLSPVSVVLFLLVELLTPNPRMSAVCAALAACANGVRLAGWYSFRYWRVPLLWVLHLGYGWIAFGFALKVAAGLGLISPQFTVHAFTVGGIGVLTLGMMARVALGHTGRPLEAAPDAIAAFLLMNMAALTRGVLPIISPQWFVQLVVASGALWILAFVLFVVRYTPILTRPRVDGRPE